MLRARLQLCIFIVALLQLFPASSFAKSDACVPERLKQHVPLTDFFCSPQPALGHKYEDGYSEFYRNSNAILIIERDYQDDAWMLTPEGANKAKNALIDALYRDGFNVFLWVNLTGDELEMAIRDSLRYLGNDELSRLFFYYYGHGQSIEDRGFHFIPVDGASPKAKNARETYVRYNLVSDSFKNVDARHAFYAFEGCNAGAIFQTLSPNDIKARDNKNTLREDRTLMMQRQFFTATDDKGEAPATGEFAERIARAMFSPEADLNHDGYIVGRELITKVRLDYEHIGQLPPIGKEQAMDSDGEMIFGPVIGTQSNITPSVNPGREPIRSVVRTVPRPVPRPETEGASLIPPTLAIPREKTNASDAPDIFMHEGSSDSTTNRDIAIGALPRTVSPEEQYYNWTVVPAPNVTEFPRMDVPPTMTDDNVADFLSDGAGLSISGEPPGTIEELSAKEKFFDADAVLPPDAFANPSFAQPPFKRGFIKLGEVVVGSPSYNGVNIFDTSKNQLWLTKVFRPAKSRSNYWSRIEELKGRLYSATVSIDVAGRPSDYSSHTGKIWPTEEFRIAGLKIFQKADGIQEVWAAVVYGPSSR